MNKIVVKTLFFPRVCLQNVGEKTRKQCQTSTDINYCKKKKNPYYHDISAINNFQVSCIVHQK